MGCMLMRYLTERRRKRRTPTTKYQHYVVKCAKTAYLMIKNKIVNHISYAKVVKNNTKGYTQHSAVLFLVTEHGPG